MAMTIYPYLLSDTWVFDDPNTGLKEEAFVCGMTEMISRLVAIKDIPNAHHGIRLDFHAQPFEEFDVELTWLRRNDEQVVPGKVGSASQIVGNWYHGDVAGEVMQGWLCPALGLYFDAAPRKLFVRVAPLPIGVDPIWHVDRNAPTTIRFVSAKRDDNHAQE